MDRYDAIEVIAGHLRTDDLVVSTTGMISRELFSISDRPANFYMIGSMGLASALGLGLAILSTGRRVFVLEGDGSSLMSLGTLPLIAVEAPPNLVHVVLDNEAYETTGAQPSISSDVSIVEIGRAAGYKSATLVSDTPALERALAACQSGGGPHFIVAKVAIARREGIPRVTHTPEQIRDRFREQAAT